MGASSSKARNKAHLLDDKCSLASSLSFSKVLSDE
jgi:hypothetical protein